MEQPTSELVGSRLRDLFLRFPCGVLEGVRWSILCKVYVERFPEGPSPAQEPVQHVPARIWLADVAELAEEGPGATDGVFRARDTAALSKGSDGQLACWPLLIKTLGEIVRRHGGPQAPQGEGMETVGVLLSQLKPLLVRHWDPTFEERSAGFFNEAGNFVSVRKMKHLIAALLEWRGRRAALVPGSAVDAALAATPPLLLCSSQRHNDMILCCPSGEAAAVPPRPRAPAPARQRWADVGSVDDDDMGRAASDAQAQQRAEALEKESRRLRIENAELKKRLRFDSEFLHKQIRRLRIENAELKKRCFFSSHHLAEHGPPPALPLQPVFAPAVFTPVVASPSGSCETASPAVSTGHASPAQGSLTPICYAMPLSAGQPWPNALGQLVAVPISSSASVMSPFSDHSRLERMLPRSLLDSSDRASSATSMVSDESGGVAASVQFSGTDDRWACIPSGIVERHKAQFEGPGTGEGSAETVGAAGGEAAVEPEVPPS